MPSEIPSLSSDQIAAFVELARLGSLRAAAENLLITEQGLRNRLLALEKRLGVELYRKRRGPAPLWPADRARPQVSAGGDRFSPALPRAGRDVRPLGSPTLDPRRRQPIPDAIPAGRRGPAVSQGPSPDSRPPDHAQRAGGRRGPAGRSGPGLRRGCSLRSGGRARLSTPVFDGLEPDRSARPSAARAAQAGPGRPGRRAAGAVRARLDRPAARCRGLSCRRRRAAGGDGNDRHRDHRPHGRGRPGRVDRAACCPAAWSRAAGASASARWAI